PYRHKGSFKRLLGDKATNQALLNYYSMENQISENTPPTFLIHAKDDSSVTYKNSLIYRDSLKNCNVPVKYVELEKGGHGFGFNFEKTGLDWTIELKKWLYNHTDLFVKRPQKKMCKN
ncbi:MAG: prolyl oligopeptidase family serine peptidase, partial [Gillisia sp.]